MIVHEKHIPERTKDAEYVPALPGKSTHPYIDVVVMEFLIQDFPLLSCMKSCTHKDKKEREKKK